MSEPPPLPPIPLPTPRPAHNGRRYLLGLGLGCVPVLLVWLSGVFAYEVPFNYSTTSGPNIPELSSFFYIAGLILYVAAIIAMIACLSVKRVRFIGYGLLTMVLIAPIVAVVGCSAITSATHPVA